MPDAYTKFPSPFKTVNAVPGKGSKVRGLIVAYNAATTLAKVFRRIPDVVWQNVEEVVVFDDASQDDTFARHLGGMVPSIKRCETFSQTSVSSATDSAVLNDIKSRSPDFIF